MLETRQYQLRLSSQLPVLQKNMSTELELPQLAAQRQRRAGRPADVLHGGIGSRQTPEPIVSWVRDLGRKLALQNWVLGKRWCIRSRRRV